MTEGKPELVIVAKKVSAWLKRLAKQQDQHYEQNRNHLPAFADACQRDAKNYRAVAAEIDSALRAWK